MKKTPFQKLKENIAEAFAQTIVEAADSRLLPKNYTIQIDGYSAQIRFDRRSIDVNYFDGYSMAKFNPSMNWSAIGSVRWGDEDLEYAKMIGIVAENLGKLSAMLNTAENLKLLAKIRAD